MKAPVLFIFFNRLDEAVLTFEKIREYQPYEIYLSSDGARNDKQGEEELVALIRSKIRSMIDWDCRVYEKFNEQNMGCKNAVASALVWMFSTEKYGIILEDDCVPNKSFFDYCNILLKKYENEPRVGAIGGTNLTGYEPVMGESYYFSKYPMIWGWATWRRTIFEYDSKLSSWGTISSYRELLRSSSDIQEFLFWKKIFNRCKANEIETWDYQLTYQFLSKGLMSVIPGKNLITNIGFGTNATHTVSSADPGAFLESHQMKIVNNDPEIIVNRFNDRKIFMDHLGGNDFTLRKRITRKVNNVLKRNL